MEDSNELTIVTTGGSYAEEYAKRMAEDYLNMDRKTIDAIKDLVYPV